MARLLSSDYSDTELRAITHGVMSDNAFREMTDRARESLSRASGRARNYLERAYNEIVSIDLGALRDKISSVTARKRARFDLDTPLLLPELIGLQQAKSVNRRLIMTSPTLRRHYRDGLIAGYHGQYEDEEPDRDGRDNRQYRQLYTGSFIESEQDEECGFITYLEDDLIPTDYDALSQNEIANTRDNIRRAEEYVEEGLFDPTNQLGGTL